MARIFKEQIEQAILTGCSTAGSEFVYIDVGHVMAIIGVDKTVAICKQAVGMEEVDLKSEAELAAEGEPEIKELGVGKFDRLELLEAMGYEMEVKPEDRPKIVVPDGLIRKGSTPTTPTSPLTVPPKPPKLDQ